MRKVLKRAKLLCFPCRWTEKSFSRPLRTRATFSFPSILHSTQLNWARSRIGAQEGKQSFQNTVKYAHCAWVKEGKLYYLTFSITRPALEMKMENWIYFLSYDKKTRFTFSKTRTAQTSRERKQHSLSGQRDLPLAALGGGHVGRG
jgi:hypothetical protein